MQSSLHNWLVERYLPESGDNTETDLGAVMPKAYDEFVDNTIFDKHKEYEDLFIDESLSSKIILTPSDNSEIFTPVNHVIFAQNIVNESKTGKLPKTAQLFISGLASKSNLSQINPKQLATLFKTSQGLIEVPINLILYIGGLYDFYYYGNSDKDIDLKTINGLTNKNGEDLLQDSLLLNKHYGSYAFSDSIDPGLKAATIPFVKPLTPRFIDDLMSFDYESYRDTSLPRNYVDSYYDYELKTDIPLSNNIASHIPVSGYGVLNNYLNSMSYLYFNEGLDGQTKENTNLNDDKIPYHIIGNLRGKLKTFKTYNDQNINFLGSYNSYGPTVKFDLSAPEVDLNTLTTSITFDNDFIYTDKNNKEKIEFFLLLSKIKANFLGGHIDTVGVYNIVRKLCTVKNLGAKQDGIEIPDFIALMLYILMPPDGVEPDNGFNRINRNLTVLDKYSVDTRSFNGYIDIKTNEYVELYQLIYMINNLTGNALYDFFSRYLTSIWSREFNQKERNKLKALDSRGTFVVYPSCGGDIDIKNLLTQNDNDIYGLSVDNKASKDAKYEYQKTNVVHTIFETQGDAYLNSLRYIDGEFLEYSNISNDILKKYNINFLYSKINPGLLEFIEVNQNVNKFSGKYTIPTQISSLDNSIINRFDPVYFRPENAPTNGVAINYFDRYDDVYITAKTMDPEGIAKLKFDNKSLIYNTSRLFWFDTPKYESIITPEKISFEPKNQNEKPALISVDYLEYMHFNLKNRSVYDYKDGETFYSTHYNGIYTYNEFKSGLNLYITDNFINTRTASKLFSDVRQSYDYTSAKALIDVFDIDKLEDFRTLFKKFSDETQETYFNKTFNTFDFKSLLKHTTMFGYSNLPNSLTLNLRAFNKDEILALLCGYSGNYIEFASRTGLSKLINTALTLGQQDKARFVIDEFLNAKITVNNYSTGGPLTIEGSDVNNPSGLRLNSFVFNPIIAYSSNTRTYENIASALGDVLLFRTILFGDQNITSYSDSNIDIDSLVKKYVYFAGMTKSIDPSISEFFVISELTRSFFRKLNIQLNENNLKLLVTYLRSFIYDTLYKKNAITETSDYKLFNKDDEDFLEATIYPNKEGAKNEIYDYKKQAWVTVSEIKNGVLVATGNKVTYDVNAFEDLEVDLRFNEWLKNFNKQFVDKTLATLNNSLQPFYGKLFDKLSSGPSVSAGDPFSLYTEINREDVEIRTGTYYRLKTLYDKNVSFTNLNVTDERLIKQNSYELGDADVNAILNSPLFFNFNVQQQDICDDSGLLEPSNADLRDLIDYVSVLDRGNNAFGTKVYVDIVSLKQVLTDDLYKEGEINKTTSKSMWTILSKLASDHEFLLMPMTSYINLSGSVSENQNPYELAHDMFGVFRNLEMWESNPAFIFQFGSLTSSITTGNKQKKSANTNLDLANTFCLDIDQNKLDVDGNGRILNEDAPSDVRNSNVSSFIVDFANQNQNMFESIQLSTDEFANTEESIKAQVALVSSDQPVLSTGKLFSAMESRSYSCTVTSLGNATIQPLSYFYLRNVPLFYGTYWITNVSHKITPNNMSTTFKGVRQPIARKPTANIAVIRALIKKANEISAQQGYLDRNDTTPIPTSGQIYIDRAFTGVSGTTSETEYGLLYQKGTDSDKYVTYNALWVIASYLKLMTGGDETDVALIKTLISYLHNNASTLAEDYEWDIATTSEYFIDFVVYDLYHKLGYDVEPTLSLSSLLDSYPTTSGDVYQTTLTKILEFKGKPADLLTYLTLTDTEKYDPKTTLVATSDGKILTNDENLPSITFPNTALGVLNSTITRANYWISDKTKSNYQTFNGLSTYELTQIFDTNKSLAPVVDLNEYSRTAIEIANVADATYVKPPVIPMGPNFDKINEKLSTEPNGGSTASTETKEPTPRELGTLTDGTFAFGSAFSNKFQPTGYDGDDVVVYVVGGYGKNTQYSFFKMCIDSEKFEDTLKLTKHGFVNLAEFGQDTGGTGDTIYTYTLKTASDDQVKNIYVAPTQKGANRGNGLVAGWVNPLKDIYVTSGFGYQAWRGRNHEGNDLRAALGTDVYAVLDGVVVASQAMSGYGYAIILSHPNHGLSTLYGHIRERLVSAGDTVTAGQLIAKSGDEGSPGQPHLHFEVMKNAISLDNSGYFDSSNQALLTDPEPYLKGEVIPDNTGDDNQTAGTGDVVSKGLEYTVEFLKDVLKGLGVASPNESQIKFMKAWRQHEGARATYNPFNTTQKASGATNYNSVGVKNFINRSQGLKATLQTLNNGRYGAIITAIKNIKNDEDINKAMQAVNDSPWGSNFNPVNYKSWKTLNNFIYGYANEG